MLSVCHLFGVCICPSSRYILGAFDSTDFCLVASNQVPQITCRTHYLWATTCPSVPSVLILLFLLFSATSVCLCLMRSALLVFAGLPFTAFVVLINCIFNYQCIYRNQLICCPCLYNMPLFICLFGNGQNNTKFHVFDPYFSPFSIDQS